MINSQLAQEMVAKAIEMAIEKYKRPICVAVCDNYGFLLAFVRMDGAPVRSIEISQGKAYTAARMCVNTNVFLERLHRENISASYFCDSKLTGLAGGSIFKDAAGNIVGSGGVSGLTSAEDQEIADMMAEMAKKA
jgi:glc operon protein GlcG